MFGLVLLSPGLYASPLARIHRTAGPLKPGRVFLFLNDAPPKKSASSDAKEMQPDPVLREHYIRDQDESSSPALG